VDNADTARRLNTYIFFSCALYFERNIEESILTPVIWHDFLFNGLACLTTLLSALDQGPQNFFSAATHLRNESTHARLSSILMQQVEHLSAIFHEIWH